MNAPEFTVQTFQNKYLPVGGREVNAVITVTSAGGSPAGAADGEGAAEIIIIDRSGSMSGANIAEARRAAAAAVDVIRDGVGFAVVAGTSTARPVYPDDGGLAVAASDTRAAAQQAISRVKAGGGTAIGSWLRLAHHIFSTRPAALQHAILLTDGINGERPKQLDAAIRLCEGVFSCDCRGVGTGWRVAELRKISAALLGTVGIVAEPAGLAADFETIMQTAMGKEVADVMLRVQVPQTARVRFVKQTVPTIEDLTGRRAEAGRRRATTRPAPGAGRRAATTTSAWRSSPPRSGRRCRRPGSAWYGARRPGRSSSARR